ncbi:MAG TPA: cardiolipin synthase [Thermodesulfobacteriota bacterium]
MVAIDLGELAAGVSWTTVVTAVAGAYALSVAAFLILENRSPQSTFAWLFLFLLFPIGGLAVYLMFGQSRHVFSRERSLTKLIEGTALAGRSARVIAEQPDRLQTLAAGPAAAYARLATMLWATARSPLTRSNRLEVLRNAAEKYPRLVADIRAATRSVHLLYYEWASDPFTEALAERLAEAVDRGVAVRILYDPVGSLTMLRPSYVRRLRRAGIRIQPFSPLYQLHTLSYRNHRKIAVIDGTVAYSGGLNITEKHLTGPDGFTGWRDTHARVEGEAASLLQAVFATMWHNTTGEVLFDDRHFPAPPDGLPTLPIQVVSAGPDSRWKAIRLSYLAMVGMARRHVYIQSPFLILDESLAETMKTVALAGVDVRVMIAPRGAEISPAYRAGMTYALDMARAGVQVLLYQGAYFHAKTVCVDSTVCSIGSANMDIRSFAINYETNLVIYDPRVARDLEADFAEDLRHCEPFSASAYEARPLVSRFADSAARLCSPLL